jgi:hypothetical protein
MHESERAAESADGALDERWPSDSASPSLGSTQSADRPAYELKFVLDELTAASLEREFSSWMMLDPHADPALNHCYRINSLYTDTAAYDVFHRRGAYNRSKFRVRRYGEGSQVFLEKKTKRGQRVRKNRVTAAMHEIKRLADEDADHHWPGQNFRAELLRRSLRPICQIGYARRAYFSCTDEGRLRLTFDRDLRGSLVSNWSFDESRGGLPFAQGRVVCEFKYQGALPIAFKRAIETFHLVPGGFSKYRNCLQAYGVAQLEDNACA